ncbi:hypothetical protein D915_008925 [Fasciola hepatica]|uniref:Uncharacterized protein n=1 Tax=Fasciola hepatica TaxID=6192 RepID=A0A4E0RTQ3_FASHE|nr:hypothetical protein D915_008925 [Fasciola hepatica]
MKVREVGRRTLNKDGMTQRMVRIDRTLMHEFIISRDTNQTILGADLLRILNAVIDLKEYPLNTEFGSVLIVRQPSKRTYGSIASEICSSVNPVFLPTMQKLAELFATDKDLRGFCDWVEHEIPTKPGSFRPYGPRRISVYLEDKVKQQVNNMLEEGVIEEAWSSYNSPVLFVRKPNGKLRFYVDFRRENGITIHKPMPVSSVADIR